jgi:hypothetical protein
VQRRTASGPVVPGADQAFESRPRSFEPFRNAPFRSVFLLVESKRALDEIIFSFPAGGAGHAQREVKDGVGAILSSLLTSDVPESAIIAQP